MPYKIDVHEELHLLVSHITPYQASPEELNTFLDQVSTLGHQFIEAGATSMYHILVVEPREFNFVTGLRSVRLIQQHRGIINMRKRLNAMTILVGQTPKPFQILITLLSHPSFGGRKMMIFPTIEPAISFVKFDMSYREPASPETTDIS